MNMIKVGFDHAINDAHKSAQAGDIDALGRHLAAAHALALWADQSLLPGYGEHDAECWNEYWECKTTSKEDA